MLKTVRIYQRLGSGQMVKIVGVRLVVGDFDDTDLRLITGTKRENAATLYNF